MSDTKKKSIKDILTRLNKKKAEEDKIKIADKQDSKFFQRDVISTGSPYLDYRINNTIGKGGFVKGAFNLLVAGESTGKTSIALMACSNEQKKGKYAVYYDGEASVTDSYLERFGVDKSKFIYHKGRNLEEMLDDVEEMSKADDVGIIVLDSIPIFVSSVVEAKSASDNNMAVEARKWTARMSIIEGNCNRRGIAIIGISFYTMDPGAIGDPRTLKRGKWQKLMSNLTLEMTKKDTIKDENKKPIGHIIDVRTKKSKLQAYDAKDAFQINFYYEDGFNKYDEYTQVFVEEGLVLQGGPYYSFADADGVEVKFQGKTKLIEHFKSNEKDFELLLNRIGNE